MSQLFTSHGLSIGASATVLPNESSEYSGLISFRMDWFSLLACPKNPQESSPTPQFESIRVLMAIKHRRTPGLHLALALAPPAPTPTPPRCWLRAHLRGRCRPRSLQVQAPHLSPGAHADTQGCSHRGHDCKAGQGSCFTQFYRQREGDKIRRQRNVIQIKGQEKTPEEENRMKQREITYLINIQSHSNKNAN